MLSFSDGSIFACGACVYLPRPATEGERTPRIFIPVRVGRSQVQVALDTGGVYFVCDPETASLLELPNSDAFDIDTLHVRGMGYKGRLFLVSLTLLAEKGESLEVQATAFVPCDDDWPLPPYLGFHGCLENLRFAVDPETGTFCFGPLGGQWSVPTSNL